MHSPDPLVRMNVDAGTACTICGEKVSPTARVYREVSGYERHRQQGGTNALKLRRVTGRVAHAGCVDRAARGTAPGQGSLL